jgi:hypothetical protein
MEDFNTTTLEAALGRIQGASRRTARSEIRQDDRLLYDIVCHTITRS